MNIGNNISREDMDKVRLKNNAPDSKSGFEDNVSEDDSFDGLFDEINEDELFGKSDDSEDSLDSMFGDSSSNGFGNNGFGNNGFGNNSFGSNGFGNNPFGNNVPKKEDKMAKVVDASIDASIDTAKSTITIIKELIQSLKLRTADDFGYFSRNVIITGIIMTTIGILFAIISLASGIKFIGISGIAYDAIITGGVTLGTGLTMFGTVVLYLEKKGSSMGTADDMNALNDLTSVKENKTSEYVNDTEFDFDNDEFEDELDNFINSNDFGSNNNSSKPAICDDFVLEESKISDNINYDKAVDEIRENQVISREILVKTFVSLLPKCTERFSEKESISYGSSTYEAIETMCLKAMANVAKCDISEVNSTLEEAEESILAYELKMKRIVKIGMKLTPDLEREIEAYFRESSEETSVTATVAIEGDYYKIVVLKGENPIITLGDAFKQDYCYDYFMDSNNKLPIIAGVTALGKLKMVDASKLESMLIAGQPRSGKSWFLLVTIMCMIMFNSPEELQFIIIDPKVSPLFKTMSLLPHVAGLHDGNNILDIFDEIINVEAVRRKDLLNSIECDDIWAARKKGVTIPILYLVIDEYITVFNKMKDAKLDAKFNSDFRTILTQLPSLGIRLMFVPHRATGVVDKTNRTLLAFTVAIRSKIDDVKDTLGVQNWNKELVNPGDMAYKSSLDEQAMYLKGLAFTKENEQNRELIKTIARAFYKMGVLIPDMSNMPVCCNRDIEDIKSKLSSSSTDIQFTQRNVFNDID